VEDRVRTNKAMGLGNLLSASRPTPPTPVADRRDLARGVTRRPTLKPAEDITGEPSDRSTTESRLTNRGCIMSELGEIFFFIDGRG
jgi:hypothetical protein